MENEIKHIDKAAADKIINDHYSGKCSGGKYICKIEIPKFGVIFLALNDTTKVEEYGGITDVYNDDFSSSFGTEKAAEQWIREKTEKHVLKAAKIKYFSGKNFTGMIELESGSGEININNETCLNFTAEKNKNGYFLDITGGNTVRYGTWEDIGPGNTLFEIAREKLLEVRELQPINDMTYQGAAIKREPAIEDEGRER